MKVLNIALQAVFLSPEVYGVAGGTSAGTNVGHAGAGGGTVAAGVAAAVAANAAADARVSANEVEKGFVSDNSKKTYHEKLVLFAFYLLENCPEYLSNDHRNELQRCDEIDKMNAAAKPGKKDNRTRVRNYMKECFKTVQPAREGQHHNSPIKLDGEGAITYEVVRNFMETKSNTVLADRGSAEKYLADINNGVTIRDDMIDPETGKVRLVIYQSTSQYSAIRSSIAYLFKLAGVERPSKYVADMAKFMGGMKRIVQAAKQHLGLKITEGKVGMPFDVYERAAMNLFFSPEKEDVFAHLFLVLDWNLMKRAENCVDVKVNHISFTDDALVFEFAKSKGNQTGDQFGPWHVYANPKKPWICAHLAMARYLLCFPDALRGDKPLFEGTSQYNRYSSRFARLVQEMEGDLNGYDPSDFGTHSTRKGVATWVAAGCTVAPPIVSLCLRAGWSLGGVKDKYLFHENAGDQHVGRCAAGLDSTTTEFAVSRPYFDYSDLEEDERTNRETMITAWLRDRLPRDISESGFDLAFNCFATICYHYQYLNENLDKKCILRNSAAFKDVPKEFVDVAKIAYPWDKTEYTPKSSGVPPHVTQLADIKELKLKMETLQKSIMDEMRSEMDSRGFASTECNTQKITDAISKLGEMIQKINTHGARNSQPEDEVVQERVAALTMICEDDEDEEFDTGNNVDFGDDGADAVETATTRGISEAKRLAKKRKHANAMKAVGKRKLKMGSHHGILTPLPEDWEFPAMTWTQLVDNWFLGNERDNLPPIVDMDSKMLKHCNKKCGNRMRNNMKLFMSAIKDEAERKACWKGDKSECWTNVSIRDMIHMIRTDFERQHMSQQNRREESSWSTVYGRMSRKGVFTRLREAREAAAQA